ncbi:hypothetical protein GCM10027342_06040 [Photobacterium alginatilyticum]
MKDKPVVSEYYRNIELNYLNNKDKSCLERLCDRARDPWGWDGIGGLWCWIGAVAVN